MPDNIPSISDIVNQLPSKLQHRFISLGSYVQAIIAEEADKHNKTIRLRPEDKQVIQLAAFIYSLDSFLRAGSRAAKDASETFRDFGMTGFQVGNTQFTPSNSNTRRGESLAKGLRAVVAQTPLMTYIRSARSMRDLVAWMVREVSNE